MGEKNSFKEKLEKGQFVITTEIGPPKGVYYKTCLEDLEALKGRIDAVNVTDQQSSIMRLGSLALSHILFKEGYNPIYQVTCRDRNRIALQSDILSASVLGINNVLVLTGDYPTSGDHPEAKAVFDVDSVQLLGIISRLQEGFDMAGNKLQGKPEFFVGAAVNPGVNPIEPEIIKMEKKIRAGASFFQTQAVYDISHFRNFLDKIEHIDVPIIAGIVPLKSISMANYINENLAGVNIPLDYIDELSNADNVKNKSVELCAEFIKKLKGLVAGVHIMPINWPGVVERILDKLE